MIEEYLKGNVYFVCYKDGCLWYQAGRHSSETPIIFPIPVHLGLGELLACDRAFLYEEYIRQFLSKEG